MPSDDSKGRNRIGRPPAGARAGEKVKDYPQLSIRVPGEVRATLQALSIATSRPQWRVITDAIVCYLRQRSPAERRTVRAMVARARPWRAPAQPRRGGR